MKTNSGMTEKKEINQFMDFHNHTTWSDGENSVAEIMEHAKKCQISMIGICDHFLASETLTLNEDELDEYAADLNRVGGIYRAEVCLVKGLEIPIFALNHIWDDTLIQKINQFDYVLIEDYNNASDSTNFLHARSNIQKIQCAKGLAHTAPTEKTITFMEENDLFWELNIGAAYDFYRYIDECEKEYVKSIFSSLNRKHIKVSIGTDSHTLTDYPLGYLREANRMAERYLSKLNIAEES